MKDVVIIGAGVIGCAAARELGRYHANVCVLEREEDVCTGTSKANSGIVHAGHDAPVGSLKARFNVTGNRMMDEISRDLDVPFKRCGALVVCTDASQRKDLERLYARGCANGVHGLSIIEADALRAMEPNIASNAAAALYAPTSGIVCPFKLTIAMAENACQNGVQFRFNTPVTEVKRAEDGSYIVSTPTETYHARCIVNAAGLYADKIHNMVSAKVLHIVPRRGEYCLCDRQAGNHVSRTVFMMPTAMGKGILVTPTVHGNLLIGPTAENIEDREATCTTAAGLERVISGAGQSVERIPFGQVISSFAGLRASEDGGDFIIGEPLDAPRFYDCAGIDSPGLTAAPAIGRYIAQSIRDALDLPINPEAQMIRRDIISAAHLTPEERNALIRTNPAYGTIVCRCESVSEAEIVEAIHRNPGARSLDGVKRRTRAGMGRCQSGFCMHRVMQIISRECSIPMEQVTKSGGSSAVVFNDSPDSPFNNERKCEGETDDIV